MEGTLRTAVRPQWAEPERVVGFEVDGRGDQPPCSILLVIPRFDSFHPECRTKELPVRLAHWRPEGEGQLSVAVRVGDLLRFPRHASERTDSRSRCGCSNGSAGTSRRPCRKWLRSPWTSRLVVPLSLTATSPARSFAARTSRPGGSTRTAGGRRDRRVSSRAACTCLGRPGGRRGAGHGASVREVSR